MSYKFRTRVHTDHIWIIREMGMGMEWLKSQNINWQGNQIYLIVEKDPVRQAVYNTLGKCKAKSTTIANGKGLEVIPDWKLRQLQVKRVEDTTATSILTVTDSSAFRWNKHHFALGVRMRSP